MPKTLAILGVLLLPLLSGCSKHGKAAPVGGSDVPPSQVVLARRVELAEAEKGCLASYVETVGYLEAEGETNIAAGVTGVVDEVLFKEGQVVDRDTVLVKVDQRRYEASVKAAQANEMRAEANLSLAKDMEHRAYQAGIGASAEEKARAALSLNMAKAELESSQAALEMARNNLDRSRVRAPYTGQVNKRMVTRGSYLEEKSPIATMADLSRLRLVGYIPEKAVPTVQKMMLNQDRTRAAVLACGFLQWPEFPAGLAGVLLDGDGELTSNYSLEFTLLPLPQRTFHGRIFYLSTTASPDTHMFDCKAIVNIPPDLDVELKPGFTARIRCPLPGNTAACLVPEESVRASERGFIAFVPVPRSDGQPGWVAEARTVELGYRSQGMVEVTRGIKPGEKIVRKGAEALENGTPIQF